MHANRHADGERQWDSTPPGLDALVDALRTAPQEQELRGLAPLVLQFRQQQASRLRRGARRSLTVGAVAIVTSLAGGAVAAAAYTAHLPEPAQRAAHRVLGKLGVPAPHPHVVGARRPDTHGSAFTEGGTSPTHHRLLTTGQQLTPSPAAKPTVPSSRPTVSPKPTASPAPRHAAPPLPLVSPKPVGSPRPGPSASPSP